MYRRTRIFPPLLGVALLLSSCVTTNDTDPYPRGWPAMEALPAGGVCPMLEGIYAEKGKRPPLITTGRPCIYDSGECLSLTFSMLFGAHIDIFAGEFKRSVPERVIIRQPSPGTIEVTTEPAGETGTLSMADGDYSCSDAGLRLKERSDKAILLFSNALSQESRTFNVAEDGSLIMHARWRNRGHHTVFPIDVRNETWVLWEPAQ